MSEKKETDKRLYPLFVVAGIAAVIIIQIVRGNREQVLEFLQSAGLLLGGLAFMVTVHEWGHYITAKMFGMRVEKFYLFFDAWGVKIWNTFRNGTEYGIGWLPLGGYVKISGLVDENMDADFLESEPQPYEFRAKPAWQRLIVMCGGVIMNVITGILVLALMKFMYGEKHIPMEKITAGIYVTDSVEIQTKGIKDTTVQKIPTLGHLIGLKTGDQLVSFKGEKFKYFDEYTNPNLMLQNEAYYEVLRGGQTVKLPIPEDALNKVQNEEVIPKLCTINLPAIVDVDSTRPAFKAGIRNGDRLLRIDSTDLSLYHELMDYMKAKNANDSVTLTYSRAGKVQTVGIRLDKNAKMGVIVNEDTLDAMTLTIDNGLFASLGKGSVLAFTVLGDNLSGFKKLFTGHLDTRKSMSGVVGMGQVYKKAVDSGGFRGFLFITGLLSMMLAFFNIFPLPLPVLDGGHVVFLLWEWITGKAVPMKIFFRAQQIGLVLVLGLIIFTNLNDVLKLFGI